jgi:hypothetical protein
LRIESLEGRVRALGRLSAHLTEVDWILVFEHMDAQGIFDGEPDFPVALEAYRRAVQAAGEDGPGGEYLSGWQWIAEMYGRVRACKPPVTEAEFGELAEWFDANEGRLPRDEWLDIGGGRRVDRVNLRHQFSKGPRSSGVTELVEDLRRLRGVLA